MENDAQGAFAGALRNEAEAGEFDPLSERGMLEELLLDAQGAFARALRNEVEAGEFDPLSEREMLEELLLFVENLERDGSFITHRTIGGVNHTVLDFLGRKDAIVAALRGEIEYGDLDSMARMRPMKTSL